MSIKTPENFNYIIPRIIRIRDAPFYLGMDKNRFNAEVRPLLTEIKIGTQGVAFDRLELDAFVDELKSRIGKPGTYKQNKQDKQEQKPWQRKSRASSKGASVGTSTKLSKADAFAKALAQATSKKRNAT
jgi:Zn-finger nucleic acid-binding protein